ncbi:SDR family NAD(P)-dependent oxidoreductase [Halopseudomonas aestusnigri]|jgi:short-subunit dehydrogenase|uniref:SDR family NAD(P)-dependent oxidoreductase n=1 Tax=Halopseudomonas TaxID=2901189 RepID=UPI000C3ACFC8|nr:SDR family NAD(P)-dependent oxidoreductase [Halopseudomonas aestusnigri]MAD27022.1 acetoin dehydrogenase [Pseudomonadales bacterium]UGV32261.1 SDR family NAD(P)-dependent oxidoreductase [Halopseudomonas aestusnigri]
MQIKDCVAVLTGAGSGIGRALAVALARSGCHLALVDLNPDSLAETATQARALGARVSEHPTDVSDRSAVAALPSAVVAEHGSVDLLINNAGVALGGTFDQVSEENFDWLMSINFDAVVTLCRAFLPLLRQRPEARIVNISSLFGLITPAGQTAYCASKFAVRGFSNALRLELTNTNVGVTVVHPGGVATAIATSARSPDCESDAEKQRKLARANRLLRMPPPKAAQIILRGIERNKPRVIVGNDARILSWLERLMPVNYWRLLPGLADSDA